jgi:hypothetical protein
VSLPWSSAVAASLQRDRQQFLVAFVELRARLRGTVPSDFAGGDGERDEALEQTERDYVALVETGESDGFAWPHRDGLKWLHFAVVGVLAG